MNVKYGMLNGIILSKYHKLCKIRLDIRKSMLLPGHYDSVTLPKWVMVENRDCQKCKKCTDFTQIHPILALLRMTLR